MTYDPAGFKAKERRMRGLEADYENKLARVSGMWTYLNMTFPGWNAMLGTCENLTHRRCYHFDWHSEIEMHTPAWNKLTFV